MQYTYIFGHKNPDTDSVCSSIALSYLKNKLGEHTIPRVLGTINKETKFVLNYFNISEPEYLNDVKIQIRNMKYNINAFVSEYSSINYAFNFMHDKKLSGCPVVDDNRKLLGIVTLKEIAKELIYGDIDHLNTNYNNIVDALEGKEILKFDNEIKGIITVASYKTATFVDSIILDSKDILILGDRPEILKYAVKSKVKLIILVGNNKLPEELMSTAKENKVNVISTSYSSYRTANKIKLSNYVKNIMVNEEPIYVNLFDYRSDFIEITNKYGHTNYPVVNKKNECVGSIKATQVNTYDKQDVILVDHNQPSQSVDGLEEAEIIEVVDHHNLGTIGTNFPINFRVMPVGSTCTVIYQLFLENRVEIPEDIAGIMLASLLSDTLLLKSPTTIQTDRDVAASLSKLSKKDIYSFGEEMFKAGSSIEGMSIEDVFYNDFKTYKYEDKNIGISQVITMDYDTIEKDKNKYVELINNIKRNNYMIVLLFITDVLRNGSYVLYSTEEEDIIKESYDIKDIEQGAFIENLVSRKKQMVPDLLETIERQN